MINPEFGTKRECPKCLTRFYDLNRSQGPCPSCATNYEIEARTVPGVKKAPSVEPDLVHKEKVKISDGVDLEEGIDLDDENFSATSNSENLLEEDSDDSGDMSLIIKPQAHLPDEKRDEDV